MQDIGTVVLVVVLLALLVGYVVFWLRTWDDIQRADLTASERGMWSLAILVLQFFGPLAWWLSGPGQRRR